MPKLSDILSQTDFANMPIKELVDLEASLENMEIKNEEKKLLREIQWKIGQRYKKEHMDRFSVHELRTGYKEESWSSWETVGILRQENGWNGNNGWKFHLDVVPNRKHPVTKAVSEFLLELGIEHKIAHGGSNGKGMTVYVGSYADMTRLAREVQQRFGKDVSEPPQYAKQVKEEHRFQRIVYGRFVPGREFNNYPSYGIGIGPIGPKAIAKLEDEKGVNGLHLGALVFLETQKKAKELGILKDAADLFEFSLLHEPKGDRNYAKKLEVLRHYCAHRLYAEALGEYYCGTDLDRFEQSFFRKMLPEKGTEERKKWDEVAAVYIQETKTQYPEYYETIKNLSAGYIPVDFSKLPASRETTRDKKKQEREQKTDTAPRKKEEKKQNPTATPPNKKQDKPKEETAQKTMVINKPERSSEPPVKKEKKEAPQLVPDKVVADEQIVEKPAEQKTTETDKSFKEPWRAFYQREAAKEKAEYQEDMEAENYKAALLRTNGEKLEITATPQHHVSLTAKDKDNKSKVPDYADFNKLVLAAKEQGKTISFGNIKSPEFKARLMLACLENNVGIKTLPPFESLKGLNPETRERLMGHKIKLLKRMVQDKEKTGSYSGLSVEDKEKREKLEQNRKIVREGRKNNQTATPEYETARHFLIQRRAQMKE